MVLAWLLDWTNIWYLIKMQLVWNFVFGSLVFKEVWKYTERHRVKDKYLQSLYYSTCRYDAQRWNGKKMYFMAITVMPIRLFFVCTVTAWCGMICL